VNFSDHPLFLSLTPVFLLIALGYVAGQRRWVREAAVPDLSNLVFLVLIPALLFRTMSSVRFETLDLRPVLAYFVAGGALLLVSIALRGLNRESVVLALAGVFSNMVMIGITLVGLAYGQAGLVTMLTLVSVHALILLSAATLILELAAAREHHAAGGQAPSVWRTVWSAAKSAVIHPVPLPIVCGLLYAQTGWGLPMVIDRPLQLLGSAFGPVSLLLVGVTLAHTALGGHVRTAFWVVASKNLLLPVLVGASAWAFGITGLPLTVMVVAAALPSGANVFLFAQRYGVAQAQTTAAMGLSTAVSALTLSAVMALMAWFNG
jgi:malonate transporter and related proteins